MGNNRNTATRSRQTVAANTKPKKIKIERKDPETLPAVEKSPTNVQTSTTPTELAENKPAVTKSNISNDPLPKFAEKQRASKENQTDPNKKRIAVTSPNFEVNRDSKTRSSTQDLPAKTTLESKAKSNRPEQTGRPIATIITNRKPSQTLPAPKSALRQKRLIVPSRGLPSLLHQNQLTRALIRRLLQRQR
jgi:hypothetical protein